jgi:hypothetical protein
MEAIELEAYLEDCTYVLPDGDGKIYNGKLRISVGFYPRFEHAKYFSNIEIDSNIKYDINFKSPTYILK